MGTSKGILGDLLGDSKLLWFIILFLLLFWCCGAYKTNMRDDDLSTGLNID